jgi:hypothetical protein
MKWIFYLGFGLLPLWLAIAAVVGGGHQTYVPTDYWTAAPWLIFFSVPFCGFTLFIASNTMQAYGRSSDGGRLANAGARFVLLNFLLVAAVVAFVVFKKTERRSVLEERAQVEAFVAHNSQVEAAAGGGVHTTGANEYGTSPVRGASIRYDVYVVGQKTVFAIVDVQHHWFGKPSFTLACTTPISSGNRQAFKDPCLP